jgi:hypothetical protein
VATALVYFTLFRLQDCAEGLHLLVDDVFLLKAPVPDAYHNRLPSSSGPVLWFAVGAGITPKAVG